MMKSTKKCPLFSTISLAADGDEVAIEKILNHYDAYISKASLRPFYDEHGNMYIVVDMELKGRIRAALIKAILGFDIVNIGLHFFLKDVRPMLPPVMNRSIVDA